MRKIYALLLILFLPFSFVSAQPYTTVSDGDWDTPATWDANGIPDINLSSGTITIAHAVTFNGELFMFDGTLTINSGASLDIQSGSWEIWVEDAVTVEGTLIFSGSTAGLFWEFGYPHINGNAVWALDGGDFPLMSWGEFSLLKLTGMTSAFPNFVDAIYNDLEISSAGMAQDIQVDNSIVDRFTNITLSNTNSNAIKLEPNVLTTVSGDLTISSSGKLKVVPTSYLTVDGTLTNSAGNGAIEIQSNSTSTGSIIASNSFGGTFQQYVSSGKWHLIAPPFSGVDSYDFWDESNDSYMRPYVVSTGSWGAYYGAPEEPLSTKTGYALWETVDFTFEKGGTFLTDSQAFTLGTGGVDNYNLLGNPYPCGINWSSVTKTALSSNAYYFYSGTGYVTHDGNTGTGNGIIPPMQGFFVQYIGSGSLSVSDSDKAHALRGIYKSSNVDDFKNHFKIRLSSDETESTCVLYQLDGMTNGDDGRFDCSILFNNDPDFMEVYSLADDKPCAINVYGELSFDVNLGLRIPAGGGEFTLDSYDFLYMEDYVIVTLEDLSTGDIINFDEGSTYTFATSESGIIEDRFVIHVNSTVGTQDVVESKFQVYSVGNDIRINNNCDELLRIKILNILGQELINFEVKGNDFKSVPIIDQSSSYYILSIHGETFTSSEKLYINNSFYNK